MKKPLLLPLFAVLVPALFAFLILYHEALPVPYQDDYEALLRFALRYISLPSVGAKLLYAATAQHNEYKLIFEHTLAASELNLTHHLNFAFLEACGDLFLLPIAYVLWRIYRTEPGTKDLREALLEFVPISLLFFSLSYWETLNWAMIGLQTLPVILFSVLAIFLLAPRLSEQLTDLRMFAACGAACLAACSSANGFLLLPVGLLILLPKRAYVRCAAWCAAFALPLAGYLYHYTSSAPAVVSRSAYLKRPLFFLAFLGGAVPSRWIAAALGLAILGVLLWAVRARFDRSNPAAFYVCVWILGTDALAAWVRGAGGFSTASRYSIYSILLLIFCYAFLMDHLPGAFGELPRRRVYFIALGCSLVFFFLVNARANKSLAQRRTMVFSGIESYRAQPQINSPMVDPNVKRMFPKEKKLELQILNDAVGQHVYTLPEEKLSVQTR